MSRYVKQPHGLTIGSGNFFFVLDAADLDLDGEPALELPEGVEADRDGYNAIVSFDKYSFNQVNTLNVRILTPAQQLVWQEKTIRWTREFTGVDDKPLLLPYEKRYFVLSDWWEKWLTSEVGPKYDKWDTYTRNRPREGCIFFKRRSDALLFCRKVDAMLAGIQAR